MAELSITLLMGSLLFVWYGQRYLWLYAFLLFLVSALYSGWIHAVAVPSIIVLGIIAYWYSIEKNTIRRGVVLILLIVVGLAFATHSLPGFESFTYFEGTVLSANKGEESISFKADKAVLGLFMLLAFRDALTNDVGQLANSVKQVFWVSLIGIIVIYAIGIAIGFVGIDFTPSVLILIWMARNLFFTVIAEELLIRGVIQNEIERIIKSTHASWFALFITSFIFGSLHLYGGWEFGLLATLSGLLYGYVYIKTRKIEIAILVHLILNSGTVLFLYH